MQGKHLPAHLSGTIGRWFCLLQLKTFLSHKGFKHISKFQSSSSDQWLVCFNYRDCHPGSSLCCQSAFSSVGKRRARRLVGIVRPQVGGSPQGFSSEAFLTVWDLRELCCSSLGGAVHICTCSPGAMLNTRTVTQTRRRLLSFLKNTESKPPLGEDRKLFPYCSRLPEFGKRESLGRL